MSKKKTVIVTGASSGIGQAVAIGFAKQGSNVVINYHSDEDGARETLREAEAAGAKGIIVKADVGNEQEVKNMFALTLKEFGSLNVLVCNAGLQKDNSFVNMTLEEWNQVINTNLTGQFLCAREAIKYFDTLPKVDAEDNAIGNIIFMSSVHDIIPWSGHVNYASSKGGVLMLMKSLALEVAPRKIRVNGISPGAIATDINKDVWSDEKQREELMKLIPYKRIGKADDVARLATWLGSDESDYITGTTIYIDGGMTLYPGFEDNG